MTFIISNDLTLNEKTKTHKKVLSFLIDIMNCTILNIAGLV